MLPFWACQDGCQFLPVRQSLVHWGLTACITVQLLTTALLGSWQWETYNLAVQSLEQTYPHLSAQPMGAFAVEHSPSHLYVWSCGLCGRLLHRSQASEGEGVSGVRRQTIGLRGRESLHLPVRLVRVCHSRSTCSGVLSSDPALRSVWHQLRSSQQLRGWGPMHVTIYVLKC